MSYTHPALRIPNGAFKDGYRWLNGEPSGPAPVWAKKIPPDAFAYEIPGMAIDICRVVSSKDPSQPFGESGSGELWNVKWCGVLVAGKHKLCADHGGKSLIEDKL